MQKSNAPAIITVPFASGAGTGYRNTIPIPSQIPITPGAASWTDGFPPLTMMQPGAGGIPPYGQDMNGLGYALSTINQWSQLGFVAPWSSSVSTALGGYPAGACLLRTDGLGHWLSTADNNTTNPDATGAAGWLAVRANAGKSTLPVASGTVTPDPSVLGAPLLVLTGTLTGNVTLVLPLTAGAFWSIYNATTGSFTVNVQGATGSGVVAPQNSLTDVRTDGTNFYTSSLSGGPFLPLHGTADAATKLATARTIGATGDVSWTSAAFDGTGNVSGTATIAAGAVTLAKMANFTAGALMGNPTGSAAAPSAITLLGPLQFTGSSLGLSYTPVNKAGDTMTGDLIISKANPTIALNKAASGQQNTIFGETNGSVRWSMLLGNNEAESGSNAGSNFNLARYTDGGASIDIPFGVNRASGLVSIGTGGQAVAGRLSVGTANAAGDQLDVYTSGGRAIIGWNGSGINFYAVNLANSAFIAQYFTGTSHNFASQVNAPSFNVTSDRRLKHVLDNQVEPRNLAFHASLIRYVLHDEPGRVRVGLGAQDVAAIAPEYVGHRPDGYLSLDYAALAVEQAWHNERRLATLEARLAVLEQRVH